MEARLLQLASDHAHPAVLPLVIRVDTVAGAATLHLEGELDMDTAPDLIRCAETLLASGHGDLALDLTRVSFCDARGLHALFVIADGCRDRDGSLAIRGATGIVAAVMAITGAGEHLRR
jgi:anti-anti-sigma factor